MNFEKNMITLKQIKEKRDKKNKTFKVILKTPWNETKLSDVIHLVDKKVQYGEEFGVNDYSVLEYDKETKVFTLEIELDVSDFDFDFEE